MLIIFTYLWKIAHVIYFLYLLTSTFIYNILYRTYIRFLWTEIKALFISEEVKAHPGPSIGVQQVSISESHLLHLDKNNNSKNLH